LLTHHQKLLRDHSGIKDPVQQDHYLAKNWKKEIGGWLSKVISASGQGPNQHAGQPYITCAVVTDAFQPSLE